MTVQAYFQPRSVPEALDLLTRHGPDLLVMAGGTVAMPLLNDGLSLPERVMTLRQAGLSGIERIDGAIRIGATTTLTALAAQAELPLLADAANATASWAIRNLGTVGGNLFTPPPGGDVAVALLALDAAVVVAGPRGERRLAISDFFTGFMTTALAPDELVVRIDVPVAAGRTAYSKFGRKHANTPAVVTVAAWAVVDGATVQDVRLTLGAVGPHPIRTRRAEEALVGRALDGDVIASAADAAADESEPFSDAIASAWYRRRMVRLFVARALERLAGAAT